MGSRNIISLQYVLGSKLMKKYFAIYLVMNNYFSNLIETFSTGFINCNIIRIWVNLFINILLFCSFKTFDSFVQTIRFLINKILFVRIGSKSIVLNQCNYLLKTLASEQMRKNVTKIKGVVEEVSESKFRNKLLLKFSSDLFFLF